MGIYVYTLRKKTVNIHIGGKAVPVNYFSFAYKERGFPTSNERRKYERYARMGLEAFESERSGYAVLCSIEELENSWVYTNLTRGRWVDTGEFPGEMIGWVHREGRQLSCRPYSMWMKLKGQEMREVLLPDGSMKWEYRGPC